MPCVFNISIFSQHSGAAEWNDLWYVLSSVTFSKLSTYSVCRRALAQTPDCYQLFLEVLSKHHQKQVSPAASSCLCLPHVYALDTVSIGSECKPFQYLRNSLFMLGAGRLCTSGTLSSSPHRVHLPFTALLCVCAFLLIFN